MQYSIVKTDDSYVIRVGDQDFLKVTSKRKAVRLISDVQKRSEVADDHDAEDESEESDAEDESEESDDAPRLCFRRGD